MALVSLNIPADCLWMEKTQPWHVFSPNLSPNLSLIKTTSAFWPSHRHKSPNPTVCRGCLSLQYVHESISGGYLRQTNIARWRSIDKSNVQSGYCCYYYYWPVNNWMFLTSFFLSVTTTIPNKQFKSVLVNPNWSPINRNRRVFSSFPTPSASSGWWYEDRIYLSLAIDRWLAVLVPGNRVS